MLLRNRKFISGADLAKQQINALNRETIVAFDIHDNAYKNFSLEIQVFLRKVSTSY